MVLDYIDSRSLPSSVVSILIYNHETNKFIFLKNHASCYIYLKIIYNYRLLVHWTCAVNLSRPILTNFQIISP